MAGSDQKTGETGQLRRASTEAKKARALPLLVAGRTHAEIAAEVGASERAVRRWIGEDPRFRAALEGARERAETKVADLAESDDDSIADALERRRFWTAMMRGEEGGEAKDRLKASELLGKAGGDFVTRVEQSGPDGGPVQSEVRVLAVTIDVARELAQEGSGR